MAKIVDYPRASLQNSVALADAVAALGGTASIEMAAEKLHKKPSGAFSALMSATVKYGLLSSKDGRLLNQPLYREIKLAYTEEERRQKLQAAFLSPPLFQSIAARFGGQSLPVEHFEKLLIREFDVPQEMASRVATYFIAGAKQCGMLSADNVLVGGGSRVIEPPKEERKVSDLQEPSSEEGVDQIETVASVSDGSYSVTVRGPGLQSTVLVRDEEDLVIVEALLAKVKKGLSRIQK